MVQEEDYILLHLGFYLTQRGTSEWPFLNYSILRKK